MYGKQQGWTGLSLVLVLWGVLLSLHLVFARQVMLEQKVFTLAGQAREAAIHAESGLQYAFFSLRNGHGLEIPDDETEIKTLSHRHKRITAKGYSQDKKMSVVQTFDVTWQPFLQKIPPQTVWIYEKDPPWIWAEADPKLHALSSGFIEHKNCQRIFNTALILVEGDCILRQNLGSVNAPVLLLIIEGDVTLAKGVKLFGLLGFFSATARRLRLDADAEIYGAVVSAGKLTGDFSHQVVWDKQSISKIQQFGQWFRVAGTWQQNP